MSYIAYKIYFVTEYWKFNKTLKNKTTLKDEKMFKQNSLFPNKTQVEKTNYITITYTISK